MLVLVVLILNCHSVALDVRVALIANVFLFDGCDKDESNVGFGDGESGNAIQQFQKYNQTKNRP